LMDVPVEHGHGPEPFQELERAGSILRAPAPLLVYGPQRNVSEHYDRCLGRPVIEIAREPCELLVAKVAESWKQWTGLPGSRLQVLHVYETRPLQHSWNGAFPPGETRRLFQPSGA